MLERLFHLRDRGTTPRTEVLAGATTFLTMVYIVVVNPSILAQAGIDPGAAFVATCLAAAIGSALMGLLANLPIALAPGMGLNAYFAFAVVLGMGVSWQVALGAVFLSGLIFLAVSLLRVREWLVNGIPLSLKLGIAAGIGFFLGLIGLKGMGLVVAHPATLVGLGRLGEVPVLLSCLGFLLIAGLSARRVPGAIIIGITVVALLGVPFGLTQFQGVVSLPPSLGPSFLQLDIAGALRLGVLGIVFTFFLVDLLDNTGTLIATTHRAGLMRPDGTVPGLGRALLADSGGAITGAVLGTSTTVSYIESAAGIEAGGRTGLVAVTAAVLFLAVLFLAPLATAIPGFATAPALVFVACLMAQALRGVDWDEATRVCAGGHHRPGDALHLLHRHRHRDRLHHLCRAQAGRRGGRGRSSGAVWLIAALCVVKFAVT